MSSVLLMNILIADFDGQDRDHDERPEKVLQI